jgi:hypothetical protein
MNVSGAFHPLTARAIRAAANRSRRFRVIVLATGAATPDIARALRLPAKTVRHWREGVEIMPPEHFEVIAAAWRRENETLDSNEARGFLEFLPVYARAAHLPGFN